METTVEKIEVDVMTKLCISTIGNMTPEAIVNHHRRTGLAVSYFSPKPSLKLKIENIRGGFRITR